MSRVLMLSDDLIREALAPAPGLVTPEGLLDGIEAGVRRTGQRRTVADRLGVVAPALHLELADRRLGWLLAAALLAVIVLGAAAVGAWLLRDDSAIDLVPTGVDVLAPGATGFSDVVVDGHGRGWAVGPGHVTRFDLATGERRAWTIADDEAFATVSAIGGARAGGIWMARGSGIVRFDGRAFREQVATPFDPASLVTEAGDGSLWALSFDEGIWRRTGATWDRLPGAGSCFELVVVAPDDAWVACRNYGWASVAHLVDGRWVTFDRDDLPILYDIETFSLAAGRGGDLWVATPDVVARWSDGTWSEIDGPGWDIEQLVVLANGDLLAASLGDRAMLARHDGSTWWPIAAPGGDAIILQGILVAGAEVLASTEDGVYRLTGTTWSSLLRHSTAGPSLSVETWTSDGGIVAVSADEAWVADDRGAWHYILDRWVGPDRPADLDPRARIMGMAVSPSDGDLALATSEGVAVRRDGAWSWGWLGDARAVGYAPDGSIWAQATGRRLIQISEVAGGLVSRSIDCPAGGLLLAVATDGTAYTGGIAYGGTWGIARADRAGCEEVPGSSKEISVVSLGADPTGGIVAVILEGGFRDPRTLSILRYDRESWSTLRHDEPSRHAGFGGDLAVDEQGRVWLSEFIAPESGIQRYEDGTWHMATDLDMGTHLSIAPDGTLWMTGSSGIERISADELR